MRHAKSRLQIYAKDTALIDFATSGTEEAPQSILRQMTAIRESDSHIFEVFIVLSNDKTIESGKSKPTGAVQNVDTTSPCLSSERADNYNHTDPWTVTIGVPIVGESNENLGVLAVDLDYCLFKHMVSAFDMGKHGDIMVFGSGGELVFHTDQIFFT